MTRLEKLKKLLEADPRDAFVLYAVAQEHAKAGDHGQAVAYYDRCLEVDPTYLYAYYHKAVSLREFGDAAGARITAARGTEAARAAADGKALGELTALTDELGES